MWQNIGEVKFWRIYAYQTFGGNKLANSLCSTFKMFQNANFGELTVNHQIR